MSIKKVTLINFKSTKEVFLELHNLTCLIGENGTGKSNILKGIIFFYESLVSNIKGKDFIDKFNPFLDYFQIEIVYDLTKILKIASKNHSNNPFNSHNFFKKLLANIKPLINESDELKVILKYYKDDKKFWNVKQSTLSLLHYLFPIIYIPARHIKLTDWDVIWNIIGDISKNSKLLKEQISDEIISMFDENYKNKLSEDIKYIKEEFKNNGIHIEPFTSKQLMSHIIQLETRGKEFKYNEENLDYFSDGLNSSNYLKLLFSLVNRIQSSKLYQPIIILDEPEIGLHPKLTDELMEKYAQNSHKVNIIIATHSTRVVKNVINSVQGVLLHVSLKNQYTTIRKLTVFTESRETNIITDNEASYYFSRGILFVEGATELELFTNKRLASLFPILKYIDISSFDSNSVKLNLINPEKNKTRIPFLVLLDMDQILIYDKTKMKFSINPSGKYNPLRDKDIEIKELYHFGKKRFETLIIRRRINGLIHKTQFRADPNWQYINDPFFETLKSLIKNYCFNYRIYPVETTIEGTLVNINNMDIFIKWFVEKFPRSIIFNQLLNQHSSVYYKLTILRAIINGKLDTSNTIKSLNKPVNPNITNSLNHISTLSLEKTNGWVNEFLNFYFDSYLSLIPNKIEIFSRHFPELYAIIENVENMMREDK